MWRRWCPALGWHFLSDKPDRLERPALGSNTSSTRILRRRPEEADVPGTRTETMCGGCISTRHRHQCVPSYFIVQDSSFGVFSPAMGGALQGAVYPYCTPYGTNTGHRRG